MGTSPMPAIRVLTTAVVLFVAVQLIIPVESTQRRPTWGRMGPPSPMAIRTRRDPPPRTMMMAASGPRPSSPRRQYYNYYRPAQRPRKPYPSYIQPGPPSKLNPHASFSTQKNHYVPYPKQEFGARRPPYKYVIGGHGPPKYHRPSGSSPMKPHHNFGGSFPSKTKYNTPGRPLQTTTPSTVSFPSSDSDNAQVIKGTRENPIYQKNPKPSYNAYISTTEQNTNSDYFAAPVSTSFHAAAPGSTTLQSFIQTSNTATNYGGISKPTSEVLNGLPSSLTSYSNSPLIPNAFSASSGSPAVSYSYIEHGSSGKQQASVSNSAIATSSPQVFQAPATQSFGFVPYSNNEHSQGVTGISHPVQFPSLASGRTTRKTQKTTGESHVLSPNYYDSSSSIAVSASIPTFESHTSLESNGRLISSNNDDRFTQVSYPTNHRSSYEPNK